MPRPLRHSLPLACCVLALALSLQAAAQDNLLKNPGFEDMAGPQPANWTQPSYWSGQLSAVTEAAQVHGGQRSARLQAVLRDGRQWGRMHSAIIPVSVGLRYRFSVWAQGTGALKLGVIYYLQQRADKPTYETAWQETPAALTATWQEVVFDFSAPNPDTLQVALMIEVEGDKAAAVLDDAAFVVSRRAAGQVVVTPGYCMVQAGQKAVISVKATQEDKPLAGGTLLMLSRTREAVTPQELALDQGGLASYRFAAPAEGKGIVRLDFASADLGAAATVNADVVDAQTYQTFAAAAAKTRLDLPAHLLFLGDSLTDFLRGQNYVDQVGFWLQKTHGEQVTVKNAGVGGDFITRVWQRLNGDPKVYRLNAYDNLYDPRPTQVFIFLGHNDSKLTSTSGFKDPVVSPTDFDAQYRQTVEKIRKDTGARITILSSTSSVYEITKANAEKIVQSGKAASLFGKPEALEQFNAIAKKVAADLGCGYIDVYEPTRTFPDKPSLFQPDGVHLTLAGNHLVALCILRYLGQ